MQVHRVVPKKGRRSTDGKFTLFNLNIEGMARVKCPIGLDIKAQTPKKLDMSVVSEMFSVRRNG